jgi:acetyl esterase/lipase
MSKLMQLLTVSDYLALPSVTAVHRLPYGNNKNQFVDLFLPEQQLEKHPLVIIIHGGCWQAEFSLEPLGQLAHALAKSGVAVCNIEYRCLGNGGGWPTTFLDVAGAADFFHEIAAQYRLDLTNVVTVGHSAGGHLALWLACRHQLLPNFSLYLPNPLPIKAVISLAGIPDLQTAVSQNICDGAPQTLLGGLPDEHPAHYAEGSPAAFLPLNIPHIHLCGDQDDIVPIAYVEAFVREAKNRGDDATFIPIPQAGHFELVTTFSPAWPLVRSTILQLIKS